MRVAKIREHVGAEVSGIDLNKPLNHERETREALYNALVDNVALVIRDQDFSPTQYRQAAELFGELMEDQNRRYIVEEEPLVSVLDNRHTDSTGQPAKVAKNASWHTDHTNQEFPPKFPCLYPVALPDSGGGTALCNMRAAYESLPEDWKAKIRGMKTANTLISSARVKNGNPDIVADQEQAAVDGDPIIHPLIRTHPDSGTKSVWFHQNKTECILGMDAQETQVFLTELLEKLIRPEFTYVHEYNLGDMLIIDNRSAMHKAEFDYDHSQHRRLYRVLVRGDRPY